MFWTWFIGLFGWWRDEYPPGDLNWFELPGDPQAHLPEEYFFLWRFWWRFAWKRYIFQVEGYERQDSYWVYFRCGETSRVTKRLVRTPYVVVRIGPQATSFGVQSYLGRTYTLTPVAGPLTWIQVDQATDLLSAARFGVPYYNATCV